MDGEAGVGRGADFLLGQELGLCHTGGAIPEFDGGDHIILGDGSGEAAVPDGHVGDQVFHLRLGGQNGVDIHVGNAHGIVIAPGHGDLLIVEYAMSICSLLLIALLLFNSFQNRRLSNANSELSHTAYLDKHTGLPNKSRCEEILNSSEILDEQTACLMFDLNNLKKINDALGHQAGDVMIKGFAHLLRKAVPIYDFVGRYGGDEFVAILTNVSPEDVERFLEKLKRMSEEYNRSGTQFMPVIPLSYAAGYAHSAQVNPKNMPTLLRQADYNMYKNKTAMKAAMGQDASSR